jgi:glutamate synthase domain-containing protein 2/glutamate synthase domain-containing protein 1/glutamate synthase domain-containing protein 3
MARFWTQPTHGLSNPRHESDACGAGFICNLKGEQSHDLVCKAIEILINLTHRGACGCDALTGDGAGLLMQLPHEFLQTRCAEQGVNLPDRGEYGAGAVFLPEDAQERAYCEEKIAEIVVAEGQQFLGWRDLDRDNTVIGDTARRVEPVIRQFYVGRGVGLADDAAFERKLYVIRKVLERHIRDSGLTQKAAFYISSLSCRTLTYKGLLLADQIDRYYKELADPLLKSGIALVHQRYSTNTLPTWDLAQPFRFLCHNGEINTLQGNVNWMTARQSLFRSELFGDDIKKLFPITTPGASDSAILDNAVELLYHTGRSLAHSMTMLVPEAWQNHRTMSEEQKAFYEYHACMMEPWDGPASMPVTDGISIGAILDRNGLRPSRYSVTKDGFVVMASETGVLEIEPENVAYNGRLEPGRMFLVDTSQGRIVDDEEIKEEMSTRKPYKAWLDANLTRLVDCPPPSGKTPQEELPLLTRQRMFGYTMEELRLILGEMAINGVEPLGSMGTDTPLAVLSDRSQLLYNYFKQLFAQVTNPPLDGINEYLVTSNVTTIGAEGDLFQETPEHSRQLRLEHPVLTDGDLQRIRELDQPHLKSATLPMLFDVEGGGAALKQAMDSLCAAASAAVEAGNAILILSDRGCNRERAAIPALLASAGVHHHLIRTGQRTSCGIIVESAEPREVHHYCVLAGYGCCAVNPYLAFETLEELRQEGKLGEISHDDMVKNYLKAVDKGITKVMCKQGISTLHSYRGAQIFEAVGLGKQLVEDYFTWTESRVGGVELPEVAAEVRIRHDHAFPAVEVAEKLDLDVGGVYQWRRNGEHHLFNPHTVAKLQRATRENDEHTYSEYAEQINDQSERMCTLRGLLEFAGDREPVPLEEVESWEDICRRFKTGAMSYGSISQEAHETLAIAMNRIGGRSNSGEGGENPARFKKEENGDWKISRIKQVASGRFGVTSHYLVNADELQIKMAQGAKPGEGGELPAKKVYRWIADVRHSTPYVGLISPPPHHDIYSIEDLAQLIHDLKNANNQARINVKLVSKAGVGTIAAGVSKGKGDVVLISGWDGGTGASRETSLKHAGLPWELGIAETHQTLVENDLRSRIVVECDGQLKTGRDVAIACLLGAEEFGFATAPLVVSGCIIMRVCQKDTCPVGVATQNPDLRKKFTGKPEYVVNFFRFVAEELRRIMAQLGFRNIDEMVGRRDCLNARRASEHWKAHGVDVSPLLAEPKAPYEGVGTHCTQKQDHGLAKALDNQLIIDAGPALEQAQPVELSVRLKNINRTVGTMLSAEISRRHGGDGLPADTITINGTGSAGQSFCAFGARGLTMNVHGDANDYFCKGLSGARVSLRPPEQATFVPEENIICGNVALYGATSGEAYIRGIAGERFCVRNSGARAVVEGVGDHGCEYMTGGRAVILGKTGRNFAAGMSGGVAYVLDDSGAFARDLCNTERVELEEVTAEEDIAELRALVENHARYTGSTVAQALLDDWQAALGQFVKVMPTEYKAALERLKCEDDAVNAAS